MKNRDFLFLYDAALCNPNGDPDRENKPRMDEETNTNLVSDVRLKRYVRDYWKDQRKAIFVDMVNDAKVTMENRMRGILSDLLADQKRLNELLEDDPAALKTVERIKAVFPDDVDKRIAFLMKGTAEKAEKKELPDNKEVDVLNAALLTGIVEKEYIDVRSFGSAFAVPGFNRAITGPVQLAWGYSLNEVFLLDSKTISSIMNDDSSTFGRDFRLKYSLIAFIGTINAAAAGRTGLSEEDVTAFKDGLWESVAASPTRSKLNQYPKLFLEVTYAEGKPNGTMGDMRKLIDCDPKEGIEPQQVMGLADLRLDFSRLIDVLNRAKVDGLVEKWEVKTSFDFPISKDAFQA